MSALLSHADKLSSASAVIAVARYANDGVDSHYGLHVLPKDSPHLRTVGLFTVSAFSKLYLEYFSDPLVWHRRYLWHYPEVAYDYLRAHCIPIGWSRQMTFDNAWVYAKDDYTFDQACYAWRQGEAHRIDRLRARTVAK